VSVKKGSAEIFEFDDARSRLRASDIDPQNFLAVGPYLEAVRERQGLSIATVSDRTHIKASYIEAIERMASEALPGKAFAIGFVHSYAKALGLDPGPIVDRFKDETGFSGARKEAEIVEATPAQEATPAEPARLSLIAVLAILAFMVWCAYLVTHPGPDAIKTPLKLDGVPIAPEAAVTHSVEPAAPSPSRVEPDFKSADAPAIPVVVEAAIIERIEPVYPPGCEAGAAAIETIDIAFTVTPDGAVVSERVVASSNSCFDRAALNAVKRWRFSPRTIDGAPRPAFEQQANFRFDRPS